MAEVKMREALVERLFGSFIGAMDLLHVYVGEQLGLYNALAVAGPLTSGDLPRDVTSTSGTPGSGWNIRQ